MAFSCEVCDHRANTCVWSSAFCLNKTTTPLPFQPNLCHPQAGRLVVESHLRWYPPVPFLDACWNAPIWEMFQQEIRQFASKSDSSLKTRGRCSDVADKTCHRRWWQWSDSYWRCLLCKIFIWLGNYSITRCDIAIEFDALTDRTWKLSSCGVRSKKACPGPNEMIAYTTPFPVYMWPASDLMHFVRLHILIQFPVHVNCVVQPKLLQNKFPAEQNELTLFPHQTWTWACVLR